MRLTATNRLRSAAAFGMLAAAWALVTPLLAAALRPAYQCQSQYISELGESGAPHAALVNYAGFLPIGVLTIGFAWMCASGLRASKRTRIGLLLFSGVGWAYIVSVVFPCSPGCPSTGGLAQQVHNAFGLVEYAGGGVGIAIVGRSRQLRTRSWWIGGLSSVAAVLVLLAMVGLLTADLAPYRGWIQRGAEALLFGWMFVVSFRLWRVGDLLPRRRAAERQIESKASKMATASASGWRVWRRRDHRRRAARAAAVRPGSRGRSTPKGIGPGSV